MYLVGHSSSIELSVNACQILSLANRCADVPKIIYMVASQGVKFIYNDAKM